MLVLLKVELSPMLTAALNILLSMRIPNEQREKEVTPGQ
jgi:hypothetical protein